MADPLSTAGTAVGITSLGIQVTQALFKYYSDVKDQPSDTSRTLKKLERLCQFFGRLESYLSSRDRDEELADEVVDAIQNCGECVHELQEVVKKFDHVPSGSFQTSIRATGRRLAYPFKLSTLQKLDEDIYDAISQLSLALSLLQQGTVDQIENDVEDIKAVLATVSASIVSSEIREWLKAPDATVNFNDACAKKHPGTGLWFVKGEEFNSWLNTRGSFLWLKGFAGCGKTVLSSTAIQYARRHQRSQSQIGLCFFYFTFSDETKQDDSAMLRALILQLLSQLESTPQFLRDSYNKHKNSTPPVTTLLECLCQIVGMFSDVYVILDALDESPAVRTRSLMLTTLRSMRDWAGLHLLVTSRELPDISDSLKASQQQTITMKNNVNADIATFISEHLRSDEALQKLTKYHARIEQVLTEKAQGVFRWVECQFLEIKQCPRSPHHIEKRLNSLPQTLDETYERMLRNIPSGVQEQAQQMLSILCCAVRPLTVPELIDALAVDVIVPLRTGALPKFDIERRVQDIDDLQQVCPGFTEAVLDQKTKKVTIRIAHFSVQEYLESNRIAAPYKVENGKAHCLMASICLSILLEEGLEDLEVEDIHEQHPLAVYAAQKWSHHFHNSTPVVQLDQQTIALFMNGRGSLKASIKMWNLDNDRYGGKVEMGQWPTAIYYASLLGLSSVVEALLQKDRGVNGLEDFVALDMLNAQCGACGTPLQAAATKGHLDVVKSLLEKGANPNVKFTARDLLDSYCSPLIAAAGEGHCEVVELLLNAGARVDMALRFEFEKSKTAIKVAARRGRHKIVRILLKRGSKLERETLVAASVSGDKETVTLLLDAGSSINAPIPHDDAESALEAACRSDDEGIVQLLLREGAELTTRMPRGRTREALSQWTPYGSRNGSRNMTGMIRLLIRAFLEEDNKNVMLESRFPTYLKAAVELGDETLLSSLLKMKIKFRNLEEWGPALLEASAQGYVRIVETLLDMGVDVNFRPLRPNGRAIYPSKTWGTALQNACRNGREEVVHLILKKGGDPNAPGMDSFSRTGTAIEEALSNGHIEIAKLLLANDAALNDTMKAEALSSASANGHLHIVMFLLDRGADVNSMGKYGTPLHAAAKNSRQQIVQVLLENSADVHKEGRLYGTALEAASARGYIDIVKILLEHGAGTDSQNSNASLLTALSTALKFDRQEIVQLLFNELNNTNTTTAITTYLKEHSEILCNAAKSGYKDVVSSCLNSGVSANAMLLYQALQAASEVGQTEIVKTLLSQGANPDFHSESHSKKHMTPLIAATRCGAMDIVQLLLQAGAKINAQGHYPCHPERFACVTATFVAAKQGETETLQLLLSSGGDPNLEAKNLDGDAIFALQESTVYEHKEAVLLLLEHGANINAQSDGKTALSTASHKGRRDIVELLLQYGADINIACGKHGTALQAACAAGGHGDLVELLLKHGADVNLQAGEYGTALIAASAKGHLEIVELLLREGADFNIKAGEYGKAIIAASAWGDLKMVELLLREGADLNIWGSGKFRTAFGAALYNGHTDIAMLLLENGLSVCAALQLALEAGHKSMAEKLLPLVLDVKSQTCENQSDVQLSMVNRFLDICKGIMEIDENSKDGSYKDSYKNSNEDSNEGQNYRGTPLQIAVLEGCKGVVDLILQYGADANGPRWGLGAPLQIAASLGRKELARVLLQHGADINISHGGRYWPALLGALFNRHTEVAELLIEHGADIASDYDGTGTTLQMAAYEGDLFAAEFLIRHGSDVNAPETKKLGPALYGAVLGGHKEMVALLLDHGADANVRYKHYEGVLSAAQEAGLQNIIELLTERGVGKKT